MRWVTAIISMLLCASVHALEPEANDSIPMPEMSYHELRVIGSGTFLRSNHGFQDSGLDALAAYGVGLGWEWGFRLHRFSPFFMTLGANVQYAQSPHSEYYMGSDVHYAWYQERCSVRVRFASVRLPLAVAFEMPLRPSHARILASAGLTFAGHFWARGEMVSENNFRKATHTYNVMRKGDWSQQACSVFNLAPTLGLSLHYGHLAVSVSYSFDVLPTYSNSSSSAPITIHASALQVGVGCTLGRR